MYMHNTGVLTGINHIVKGPGAEDAPVTHQIKKVPQIWSQAFDFCQHYGTKDPVICIIFVKLNRLFMICGKIVSQSYL